jgi:ribulose-5-phosphate 4-epimerase/fuculose-1-phosphate aldolase
MTSEGPEWRRRVDLAALYRLLALNGWSDLISTHVSARVPHQPDAYLINQYGLLFDEVTASNLLRRSFDGTGQGTEALYNAAGHATHTAILAARPEIDFVIHTHTRAGVAVSAMASGLLPLSQQASVVLGTLAYHRYPTLQDEKTELRTLVESLGNKYALVLHNHGLLTCGRTAGEAFLFHYYLERACQIQVDVLKSGQETISPPSGAIAVLSAWAAHRPEPWGRREWDALLRKLDRTDSSFRT